MKAFYNLLDGIENGWTQHQAEAFIETNFKSHTDISGCDTDIYYESDVTRYRLNARLFIGISNSMERFGSTYIGGSSIYIDDIIEPRTFTLYSEDVQSDGVTVTRETQQANRMELDELRLWFKNSGEYVPTVEDFERLPSSDDDLAIYFWTGLPAEQRLDDNIAIEFARLVYEKASWKRHEILEYDRISPYGGEDIAYFPHSNGECFLDLMDSFKEFFDFSEYEFEQYTLRLLCLICPEDKYIEDMKEQMQLSIYLFGNRQGLLDSILIYCKNNNRLQKLEMDLNLLIDNQESLEARIPVLDSYVSSLTDAVNELNCMDKVWQRILFWKKCRKNLREEIRIRKELDELKNEINLCLLQLQDIKRSINNKRRSIDKESNIHLFKDKRGGKICSAFLEYAFGDAFWYNWYEEKNLPDNEEMKNTFLEFVQEREKEAMKGIKCLKSLHKPLQSRAAVRR